MNFAKCELFFILYGRVSMNLYGKASHNSKGPGGLCRTGRKLAAPFACESNAKQ